MCGIAGFIGRKDPKITGQMLDRLRHRGPDDTGIYADNTISLGMTRLSIIDIEGGRQPMSNSSGSVQVVFNGEIFNFIELREELEKKNFKFRTHSDTETIVHAYEAYGPSFTNKLNGMFAIALWDAKKKKLFLWRDRFGVKPLFYSISREGLIFASEIKALFCDPEVKKEIDPTALSHYFSLRNIPAPFTVYKQIRALEPGGCIVSDGAHHEISKWYSLYMDSKPAADENTLTDRIDELLNDSVKIRLRSDVRYGAYLSGGIDSSTVVAIMSRIASEPIKTFSLTFADAPQHKKDGEFAKLVAERYSTDHTEYSMSWQDFRDDLKQVLAHLDQPFAGVISSFWLSRQMRKDVKLALSGDGADDIFASYGHHRLVAPLERLSLLKKNGGQPQEADYGFFKDRKEFVHGLMERKPWEWRLAYAAFMEHEKGSLFSKKGRDIFHDSTPSFLKQIYETTSASEDALNKMLYLDIKTLLPNEILYYNDMLSMANSLEVRTPFLDYRLVELAAAIPGSFKIKDMTLKYILRRVAARYLPSEILERPKEGFVLPKNTWLRGPLSGLVRETLSGSRLARHGFLDENYVSLLVERFIGGDESLTFKVWTLMAFQIWYENSFS